jgi:hypothetical protein
MGRQLNTWVIEPVEQRTVRDSMMKQEPKILVHSPTMITTNGAMNSTIEPAQKDPLSLDNVVENDERLHD